MKQSEPRLEPELRALFALGKVERRAPADVRARALTNARAIIAAGGRLPTAKVLQFPRARLARRRAPVWIPLAASIAIAAAASVASVALRSPPPQALPTASPLIMLPSAVDRTQPPEVASAAPPLVTPPTASARPVRAALTSGDARALSAELDLLSRAHAAYTREEFSRALTLIAEHARRFPNGHLAEEREALRVRSLARSGHADESRGAEAAFTRRFPRSALLAHAEGSQNPK